MVQKDNAIKKGVDDPDKSSPKRTIVVMSGKGGVGKSTVAANLAFELSKKGYKIGILDSDFHGPTIPRMLGVKGKILGTEGYKIFPVKASSGLKVVSMEFLLPHKDSPVIWRGPMKMNMINQLVQKVEWGRLDYLIIDLPPGTGDEPLSIAQQLEHVDGALIITTPQDVALDAVRRSINFAKKLDMKVLGVIENMSDFECPQCGEKITLFGAGGGEDMSKELGVDYFGSIPFNSNIVGSGERGVPFSTLDDGSSNIFKDIVEKILNKLGDER